MKRMLVLLAALAVLAPLAQAQPCSVPPFLANVARPNILLVQDASGSMGSAAYYKSSNTDTLWWNGGAVRHTFYGYFEDDSMYAYSTTGKYFYSKTSATDTVPKWPGWLLNWVATSRTDVLRKVLVGGKRVVDSLRSTSTATSGNVWPTTRRLYGSSTGNYNSFTVSRTGTITQISSGKTGTPPINATALSSANVVIRRNPNIPTRGVIHQIGDKDQNGKWDDDAPKLGLWTFNAEISSSPVRDGGRMVCYPGHDSLRILVDSINKLDPNTYTPLAENLYEITRWVAQIAPPYGNTPADYVVAASPNWYRDPYYDEKSSQWAPCTKTFVVLLTDGQPTEDQNIPTTGSGLPGNPNLQTYYNGTAPGSVPPTNGSNWLDDVTYYAHRIDLRTTIDMPGQQSIAFYGVFCFGTGGLLRSACKVGGFKCEYPTDTPDTLAEYSTDGDTIPDNYFEADDGYMMENQIRAALVAIMAQSAASSAVSVISGSSNGEGTMQQAYFAQNRIVGADEVRWPGFLRALWVDRWGQIREDTDNDRKLTIKGNASNSDLVVRFFNDPSNNAPKDSLFYSANGDTHLTFTSITSPDSLKDVWNAGKWLYQNSPGSRTVYTDTGASKISLSGAGSSLYTKMRLPNAATADSVINYVLGTDYTGWRPRKFSGTVWKLGDIINSAPMYISKPAERYDQLYGDASYATFYASNKNRTNVVLVGANDGMIHCFYAGKYVSSSNPMSNTVGWLDSNSTPLGKELWAYVPKGALPHLKWLKDNNYCHVYYNDLKAKITDVKIGGAWKTVAIVGMRLGGDSATAGGVTYRSSYICFDITNPDTCKPLWEFSGSAGDSLGFTVSYPCVAAFDSAAGAAASPKFYAVFGGGPTTKDGLSSRRPKVFVVNIATGALAASFATSDANCSVGDAIAADFDLNFECDAIYFGTYSQQMNKTGQLYRLVCRTSPNTAGTESDNPANWTLYPMLNLQRPFSAAPCIATDQKGLTWVYAGTGRYFSDADEVDSTTNYMLGIRDTKFDSTYTLAQLTNVTGYLVRSADSVSTNGGTTWVTWRSFANTMDNIKGWYRTLDKTTTGSNAYTERVLSKPAIIGGALFLSSFQPTGDPCAIGGNGYLYALFYTTGTAYYNAIIPRNGATSNPVRVSLGGGVPSAPSLHVGSNGQSAFIQTPTGAVLNIGTMLPFNPRSGSLFWKQQ